MRIKGWLLAASIVLPGLPAGAQVPDLVAGFDFSQYQGDGALSIDGGNTFQNTLTANYSDFDPTNNAGAESAAFGGLFFNGQFGSDNLAATGLPTDRFIPSAAVGGSLNSGLNLPLNGTGNPFDSFTVLEAEGQFSQQSLAMTVRGTTPVRVVFMSNLAPASLTGSNYRLDFAARTAGGTATIGIEFSVDGINYTAISTVTINEVDTAFNAILSGAGLMSPTAFVRLTLGGGTAQSFIDNVGISAGQTAAVPEPATLGLLALGLAAFAWRRQRSLVTA